MAARRLKRLRRTAALFQVWVCSAKDDGKTYWLAYSSKDWKKAAEEYRETRADYVKCELRDPTNHVLASWDVGRVDPKDRDFCLDYHHIPRGEFDLQTCQGAP